MGVKEAAHCTCNLYSRFALVFIVTRYAVLFAAVVSANEILNK